MADETFPVVDVTRIQWAIEWRRCRKSRGAAGPLEVRRVYTSRLWSNDLLEYRRRVKKLQAWRSQVAWMHYLKKDLCFNRLHRGVA